jgi:hypothetical protein
MTWWKIVLERFNEGDELWRQGEGGKEAERRRSLF